MPSSTLLQLARLRSVVGIPVTITRGPQTCGLTAVPATSTTKLVGDDGSFDVVTVDDWLIVVQEWTLTEPAYPDRGDLITVDEATKYYVGHPEQTKAVFENFNQLDRPALAWTVHSLPR